MKVLFLSLLVLAGCGGQVIQENEAEGIETLRTYEPLVPSDISTVKKICDALSHKGERLSSQINMPLTFSYAQKDCAEVELPAAKDVRVTIQKPGAFYVFRKADGELFPFPDVETLDEGAMKTICADLDRITTPFQTSPTSARWFTTATSSANCRAQGEEVCILIESGSVVTGTSYKIHTREWIKFRLTDPKRGFFTERVLRSSGSCEKGSYIQKRAVLR